MHSDSSNEDLFQFGAGTLGEVVGLDAFGQNGLAFFVDQLLSLEHFGQLPALIAVEAKD